MASSNGLINDFSDIQTDKVPQATSTSYQAATVGAPAQAATEAATPTLGNVDTNQTVQGQIRGIIDENSPLQQQAKTAAMQAAAQRGLVNSSIAVTSGQDALYRAALPIAQQDASTYSQQARMNQDTKNQMEAARAAETNQSARFNAAATNDVSKANAEATNTAAAQGAAAANTVATQNAGLAAQAAAQKSQQIAQQKLQESKQAADLVLQNLDATTRTNLVNIEANYKTLMQASQSASDLYQQVVNTIGSLQNNKDLDAASRNTLIAQQTQMLQSGLNLLGNINNLNLAGLLDFSGVAPSGPPAATTPPPPPNIGQPPPYVPPESTGGL